MSSVNEKQKVLIINGSLGGSDGNTSRGIQLIEKLLTHHLIQVEIIHLKDLFFAIPNDEEAYRKLSNMIKQSQGIIFTTGTYWDSWGSPMQRFFELMTPLENNEIVLGKPVMTFVTMHSVGGKEVLSRLQGVLNTFGFFQPPLCGFVYSMVNDLIVKSKLDTSFKDDLWSLEDLTVICDNFITALNNPHQYKSWPVDREDPSRIWWK